MRRLLPSFAIGFSTLVVAAFLSVAVYAVDNSARKEIRQVEAQAFWLRYDADIAGCHRGDKIRTVLHSFLTAAAEARRTPPIDPGDTAAATEYERLDRTIWPLKRCHYLIPAPSVARPSPPN